MALQIVYLDDRKDVQLDAAYVRVRRVEADSAHQRARVTVETYANSSAFVAKKETYVTKDYIFESEEFRQLFGPGLLKSAYTALKTLPEFSQASDV